MKRRKLKAAEITLAKTTGIADRMAVDAPKKLRVVPIDVQDPYNPHETIRVMRSARDPLSWMHARGEIDEPQRIAGEQWREYTRLSQFGLGAMDSAKPYVDGGDIYEPISDAVIRANKYLKKVKDALGHFDNWILHCFLAHNLFPKDIAAIRGRRGDRKISYYANRVRDSLETVARVFTIRS